MTRCAWRLVFATIAFAGCGGDERAPAAPLSDPDAAPRAEPGAISGVVLDENGARVPFARIQIEYDWERLVDVVATETGRFGRRLDRSGLDLSTAVFTLRFVGVANRHKRVWRHTHEGSVEDVKCGVAGVELRIKPIEEGHALSVRVVDPAGEPVANAYVLGLFTNKDGWVRQAGMLEQSMQLFVSPPKSRRRTLAAPREQGTFVEMDGREVHVAFRKPGPIAGIVRDDAGAVVAGVLIRATSGKRHLCTVNSDAQGRFELVIAADERDVIVWASKSEDDRYLAAVVENVAPGTRDLEIKTTSRR